MAANVEPSLRLQLASAAMLTPFGIEFRYPGDQIVDLAVGQQAMEEARRVRGAVQAELQDYLGRGRPAAPFSGS